MNRPQNEKELLLLQRLDTLEDLTDAELEAAVAALDRDPQRAGQWAATRPAMPASFAPQAPSAATWDLTWERIASASARGGRRLQVGYWQPVAAAACVALLALALRFSSGPLAAVGPAEGWELSLATGVSVDELEVFGNTTTFVAYEGDFDDLSSTAMIWVLDAADDSMGV